MSDSEQRYRLVVLGSGRVGKSSIVRRLLKDDFVEGYRATVEDLHCREYDVDGTVIKVDILDTAGNLEFPAMRRLSISTAHAFLLVYSVDDRASFDEVQRLWEQIKSERAGYNELPCIVVGNKVDLSAAGNGQKRRREVQTDEVQLWAAGAGLPDSALMEVSARDGTDVLATFHRLLGQATSSASVRRLEPLLRRRLSGSSTRMSSARAKLREKPRGGSEGGDGDGVDGGAAPFLQIPESSSGRHSRSRSLIRRVSKPKPKRSHDSLNKNDCVIS